jgi:hypothetical protein
MSAFTVNKTSGKFQIFMFIVSINQVSDTGSSEPLVYANAAKYALAHSS